MNVAICDNDINVANYIEDLLSKISGIEFTKNLHIARWKYLSSIPNDAKELLVYVTWGEKTKTVFGKNTKKLYETSRNTLYKNKDGYYLVIEPEPSLSPVRKVYSKVTAKTAEYLLSLAGVKKN
ncbi:hypothetical protein L5D93_21660 [Paenibacillus thiaminolyticus]|nr:hypothetical protein [Paenibacillus thiaminolyticus]